MPNSKVLAPRWAQGQDRWISEGHVPGFTETGKEKQDSKMHSTSVKAKVALVTQLCH